jgi:hypothetical protein
MDILAPYNVERLLLLSSAFNFEFVKELMERYEKDSKSGVTVPDNIHNALKDVITGNSVGIYLNYFITFKNVA